MLTYILRTKNLSKTIGGRQLVTDVSMHLKKAKSMGFWDPTEPGKPQ